MASTFTPNFNMELQATGEDVNTWGQNLNNNVISTLDAALGNVLTIFVTAGTVNITTAQMNNAVIFFRGAMTGNVAVVFPEVSRTILINNSTTGSFSLSVQTSNPSSAIVPIAQTSQVFVSLQGATLSRTADVFGPVNGIVTPGNVAVWGSGNGRFIVDSGIPAPVIASQAQAQAGTDNTVYMSPLRSAQQITARIASQAVAQAGTDNNAMMTPLRTSQAIQAQAITFPATSSDPNLLSYPLGSLLLATGTLNRNQPCNIYLDASDATAYRITSNGGSMLDGTWLCRGRVSTSIMAQRIS